MVPKRSKQQEKQEALAESKNKKDNHRLKGQKAALTDISDVWVKRQGDEIATTGCPASMRVSIEIYTWKMISDACDQKSGRNDSVDSRCKGGERERIRLEPVEMKMGESFIVSQTRRLRFVDYAASDSVRRRDMQACFQRASGRGDVTDRCKGRRGARLFGRSTNGRRITVRSTMVVHIPPKHDSPYGTDSKNHANKKDPAE